MTPASETNPPELRAENKRLRNALLIAAAHIELYGHEDDCLTQRGHPNYACDCVAREPVQDIAAVLRETEPSP